MLLARVCRSTLSPQIASMLKSPVVSKPMLSQAQTVRLFTNDTRSGFTRSIRNRFKTVEETHGLPKDTALNVGKGALAGASAVGLGALCYYGLGLSSQIGAVEESALWPDYVKARIHSTYLYFGGSLIMTAATAVACVRSPAMLNLVTRQGWMAMLGSMAAMIGTGVLCQSMEYKEGFGAKQLAWLLHTGTVGAVIAPICLLGGPLLVRAAWLTAGVIGGLSTIAVCAPSERFLNMGGPLAIGLGVVFASSIGSMFLPPTTALGAGVHSMMLYGGLILFSMFLLYDTQRIIQNAKQHPHYSMMARPYDPINNSIHLYLDTINIFIRIVAILTGGGSRRK